MNNDEQSRNILINFVLNLMNNDEQSWLFLLPFIIDFRIIHAVDWMPTVLSAAGGSPGI